MLALVLVAGGVPTTLLGSRADAATSLPAGFADRLVVGVPQPTAFAFAPDGRMLVASKTGQVWLYKNNTLSSLPALDLAAVTCNNDARGLLGITLHPDFGTLGNNWVYVYYTRKENNCKKPDYGENAYNRVSRFEMIGDVIDAGSEDLLVDRMLDPNAQHDGGDVQFGKDGKLYVTVGDGSCDYRKDSGCGPNNDASRDRHVLMGKILRLNDDGTVPTDNPHVDKDNAASCAAGKIENGNWCTEVFAMGLRNPFRMVFNPNTPGDDVEFRVHDVGQGLREEINGGIAGADYGWNCFEGTVLNAARTRSKCRNLNMTKPTYQYKHSSGCSSITGGAWVPEGVWGDLAGEYLFADYVCNKIFLLVPTDNGFKRKPFATGLEPFGPIHVGFGPFFDTQTLYYSTFANGGEIRRIEQSDGNFHPVADLGEAQLWSAPPSTEISFDGSASADVEDGQDLNYLWDFGDGVQDETQTPTVTHDYLTPGKRTASLVVEDTEGKRSLPATVEVFPANTPPSDVTIATPAEGDDFVAREELTLTGTANDDEDAGDPTLNWQILQWHSNDHAHPNLAESGNGVTYDAPEPEDMSSTDPAENYLEVLLTATDSEGLRSAPEDTASRIVRPSTVNLTFVTEPVDLRFEIEGVRHEAPQTILAWEGWELTVRAKGGRDERGRSWKFVAWTDDANAPQTRVIVVPGSDATYTATYKRNRK
jgi:glucose/arabinose dehydrogenase/PKD repeat protein